MPSDQPSSEVVPPEPPAGVVANFSLTLTDAAHRLVMTPDAVTDLVRAGFLGAYVAPLHRLAERPPLRFAEEDLTVMGSVLRDPESGEVSTHPELRMVSTVHAVASALRDYLTAHAPTDSLEVAERGDAPLLAKARSGRLYAHIRAEIVGPLAREAATGRARMRLAVPSSVVDALTRLGCQQVRGIYPAGGARQSWRTWWRVPLSIWSVDSEDLFRVEDYPALGGIRESDDMPPGEPPRMARRLPREGDSRAEYGARVAQERARAEREGPDFPITPHRLRVLVAVEGGRVLAGPPGGPAWQIDGLDDQHRKGAMRACTQLFDADLINLESAGSRKVILTERGRRHLDWARQGTSTPGGNE